MSIASKWAWVWAIAIVLIIASGLVAQTSYNTVVVTNQGQFVNARLSDNVYIDMASSPPTLRARRPTLHIKPAEGNDGAWYIPSTVLLLNGMQLIVVLNGLEGTEGVDYKIDPANPRRIIPFADRTPTVMPRWHSLDRDAAGNTVDVPWNVKVHLFP